MGEPIKIDVWMPLYVADYLSSTSRLTTVQHGAYLLLIMDYWKNGRLPDDDLILSQVVKMNIDAWSIARAVLVQFFSIENGEWVHGRIEKELDIAGTNRTIAKVKAVKAANARWEKERARVLSAQSNAPSITQAMPMQCPSPSPSQETIYIPETSETTTKKPRKKQKTAISDNFCISEKVSLWASENGHQFMEKRLAHFISMCQAKGYEYVDWDAAFRNAVTGDWAKLGGAKETAQSAKPYDMNEFMMRVQGLS